MTSDCPIYSSQTLWEIDAIINPSLQMWKLSLRMVYKLSWIPYHEQVGSDLYEST
jgi:hypothetical protein